jgi:hypothetical protein
MVTKAMCEGDRIYLPRCVQAQFQAKDYHGGFKNMSEYEYWRDLSYLKHGTAVQREVYALLSELNVMTLLADHHPVLVGTVPIGIQVESSDLDIICEVHDREIFAAKASLLFSRMDDYCSESKIVDGVPRIKINFSAGGWPIELFGQPRPTGLQNGYLHMAVEDRVLKVLGDSFRQQVIALKTEGVKTELAFARLLQLEGDPYGALLKLYELSQSELEILCRERFVL